VIQQEKEGDYSVRENGSTHYEGRVSSIQEGKNKIDKLAKSDTKDYKDMTIKELKELAKEGRIEYSTDPKVGYHLEIKGPNGKKGIVYVVSDTKDDASDAFKVKIEHLKEWIKQYPDDPGNTAREAQIKDLEKRISTKDATQKYDPEFIKKVAKDFGITDLTDADCQRAHKMASNNSSNGQDYYDQLKEFFNN